ncbi:tyrosine--tRNA ligase [Mycoplasmopsis phocirhinis]|uniref:Tyrosine--tRNA ligase n=1 Tax=Mycoplasmopsis phocirhinis TaxID=142650 RepID=A0A4P6MRX2_9BACT|nr:tyrosine--tRNA ligase [Mycoplasmopsis phocirhinis]QBF34394.1 tyrosine--tRNA ligase [Mycoplasmopsis phocirhinis]
MNIIEELKQRGILKQISNLEKFNKLNPTQTAVYGGFDPTAKSLHLGNYLLMTTLKRFQLAGFDAIALVGGATGMIGDPSFKDSERVLLNNEEVVENKNRIKQQLQNIGLSVLDNYDFYKNMNVLEFLRDGGKLINISYMLAKDSVSSRIQRGLSFTEFSYQLLQGYDFLELYKQKNVMIQIGGSDQWGNITTGLDMISKVIGENNSKAVGVTFDLLTDENGKKIGKSTGGGALWLDKTLTSPFNMYQYLYNQSEQMVQKLLLWLTFISVEDIKNIMIKHQQNTSLRFAQQTLAFNVVKDIFGEDEAKIAVNITKILFNKKFDASALTVQDLEQMELYLPVSKIAINENIVQNLIKNKFIASKREAREFIQNNALKIDEEFVTELTLFNPHKYNSKFAIFKKGKKQTIILKTI